MAGIVLSVHAIAVPVQPARQFGEAVFCETEELNRQNVPDSLLKCSAKWLEWRVGLEPIALHPVGLDLNFLPVAASEFPHM